jgi:hypothetical protein
MFLKLNIRKICLAARTLQNTQKYLEKQVTMSELRKDIIIFGATGYTGKVAVKELVSLAKTKGNLTWGIAGRNKSKLEETLAEISNKTG